MKSEGGGGHALGIEVGVPWWMSGELGVPRQDQRRPQNRTQREKGPYEKG